jgi:hypothetical protein
MVTLWLKCPFNPQSSIRNSQTKFSTRERFVQSLFDHHYKSHLHHSSRGRCPVDIDLVVDPDLGDRDDFILLADLREMVTSIDQYFQFSACRGHGVCEPDRLGTERSFRGGENADHHLLFQLGEENAHLGRKFYGPSRRQDDTIHKGADLFAFREAVVPHDSPRGAG